VVRVTASRLRGKLEVDPAHPQYLQTVPGEGLMVRGEPPRAPVASAPTTAPPLDQPPVALEVVAELRELMGQTGTQPLHQLNDVFQQSSQNHLQGMRAALEDGNAEDLGREAHRLRGASGSLGAQRMARVCATIEEQARAGDLVPVDGLLRQLEREMVDFQRAIVPLLA
jgi:HPt (histidine-containing phosphotransfer) domain-containing protein